MKQGKIELVGALVTVTAANPLRADPTTRVNSMRFWSRKPAPEGEERPAKVTDPVCGMALDREKAVATVILRDRTVYFCSKACQRQFEEDPNQYLNLQSARSARKG